MEHYIIFAFIAIIAVVIIGFQLRFYRKTKSEINQLNNFFPDIESELIIVDVAVSKNDIRDVSMLKQIVRNPRAYSGRGENQIKLIEWQDTKNESSMFKDVIEKTNIYLIKNYGISADLAVLQNICDRKIESLENTIRSKINIPLFLGLGGTFVGIIFGVVAFGMGLDSFLGANTASGAEGLSALLWGVGIAMFASACGLVFTVLNSGLNLPRAERDNDSQKEEYFDFLRRELMPSLSNSMTSSLNSLKGVLGHFVDRFSKNIDGYASSAELLNSNLDKQCLVLDKINNLNLTRTSVAIASTFQTLKDSAESLQVFKSYQTELSKTMKDVSETLVGIEALSNRFRDFITILRVVAANQDETQKLHKQFSKAIELHFPLGSDARTMWLRQYEILSSEAAEMSQKLNNELSASTRYISDFVSENRRFFQCFDRIDNMVETFTDNAELQAKAFNALGEELANVRRDLIDSSMRSTEVQRTVTELVQAMKDMYTEGLKQMSEEKKQISEYIHRNEKNMADMVSEIKKLRGNETGR